MFGLAKEKEIINKGGIGRLISIYARDIWHKQNVETGNLGYGWIHYGFIRNLTPKRVLCIGSKYGFVPAVCAVGCRDGKFGKVDFVDAGFDMRDFDGPGVHWGGVGLWKRCKPKKYFGKFGLQKYINLYVMTSEMFAKKFPKRRYGYIHIDGDHSYKGVKKDFDLFWPRLNKGGFLVIHDIASPDKDGNIYGTRKFWKEIKKNSRVALGFEKDPGLGVIQKL